MPLFQSVYSISRRSDIWQASASSLELWLWPQGNTSPLMRPGRPSIRLIEDLDPRELEERLLVRGRIIGFVSHRLRKPSNRVGGNAGEPAPHGEPVPRVSRSSSSIDAGRVLQPADACTRAGGLQSAHDAGLTPRRPTRSSLTTAVCASQDDGSRPLEPRQSTVPSLLDCDCTGLIAGTASRDRFSPLSCPRRPRRTALRRSSSPQRGKPTCAGEVRATLSCCRDSCSTYALEQTNHRCSTSLRSINASFFVIWSRSRQSCEPQNHGQRFFRVKRPWSLGVRTVSVQQCVAVSRILIVLLRKNEKPPAHTTLHAAANGPAVPCLMAAVEPDLFVVLSPPRRNRLDPVPVSWSTFPFRHRRPLCKRHEERRENRADSQFPHVILPVLLLTQAFQSSRRVKLRGTRRCAGEPAV